MTLLLMLLQPHNLYIQIYSVTHLTLIITQYLLLIGEFLIYAETVSFSGAPELLVQDSEI